MRFQTLQRPLALLASFALVMGLIPTAALAEGLDALDDEPLAAAEVFDEGNLAGETGDGGTENSPAPALRDAQSDPFYFVDCQTGQPVATLHTSGTYRLFANGSAYLPEEELSSLYFTPVGNDPRGHDFAYNVSLKFPGEDDSISPLGEYLLEDLTVTMSQSSQVDWEIPSGTYKISLDDGEEPAYFSQEYRVVCDGIFVPFFDLEYENDYSFSVKDYVEGEDDDYYDGGELSYENPNNPTFVYGTPEQEAFALSSDTRIRMDVDSFYFDDDIGDTEPQLESIGLWKADDTLENLKELYRTVEYYRYYISRFFGINPTWPTYLNFSESYADKVTSLWERGTDEPLGERFNYQEHYSSFIVDCANFAATQLESGLYFPIVRMSYQGETYTFAYYPIEVDAEGAGQRKNPRITTTTLPNAREGESYTATLEGTSGAATAGTFAWSWAAAEGSSLPEGLELSEDGVITGAPTEAGTYRLAVTLEETIDDEPRSATRTLTLRVNPSASGNDAVALLALGEIGYKPGTMWLKNEYTKPDYLDLTIPVSLDLRDESYNLGETELWYMLRLETGENYQSRAYVFHERAQDLMNDDGTALKVHAMVQDGKGMIISDTKAIKSVRAFLVPKTNDGDYAFDRGDLSDGTTSGGAGLEVEPVERTLVFAFGDTDDLGNYAFVKDGGYDTYPADDYAVYENAKDALPEGIHTALNNPKVAFGSWVSISELSFEGRAENWPTATGRVTLWASDGVAIASEQGQNKTGDTFKLAPGSYTFTVEGEVPVYDEHGVESGKEWVDIVGSVPGAKALTNTYPKQHVFTVGPNEGRSLDPSVVDVIYSTENIEVPNHHSVVPTFQLASDSDRYVSAREAGARGYVQYETRWYRHVGSEDILVATGDTVMFGPSEYPLFVEVVPTGRDASFWKAKKVEVSDKKKVVEVQLERKQHFTGTFALSCTSGKTPEEGKAWGIIEVRTPTEDGGVTSSNIWAKQQTVKVPDLTSGSIVTFTPSIDLLGGPVSYTVPEEQAADFNQELEAPDLVGTITIENLSFTDVDGNTQQFALNDGQTGVRVERCEEYDGKRYYYEEPFYLVDGNNLVLQSGWDVDGAPYFMCVSTPTTYRVTITHKDASAPERFGTMASDYAAIWTSDDIVLSQTQTTGEIEKVELTSRGYALVPATNDFTQTAILLLFKTTKNEGGKVVGAELVEKGPAKPTNGVDELRTPFLDEGTYTLFTAYVDRLGGEVPYDNFGKLDEMTRATVTAPPLAARYDFEIAPNKVTSYGEELANDLWSWTASLGTGTSTTTSTSLVNKANSSVVAKVSYGDNLSITMHAELAKNVELSNDAKLEILTNQPTKDRRLGTTNPRALSINGKTLTINRWEKLFDDTQNMDNGDLTILLSEAKAQDANCAKFPMDLTLVIPYRNRDAIDASIWLVDGDKRSLVGSFHEQLYDVELTVPAVAAWQSFYVYGDAGPYAYVSVYLDGMRAATARADSYGYYTAEVTLPDDVRDFDSFELSAVAQWTSGDVTHTATSEIQEVMYSTTMPAVERITMCYQPDVGAQYEDVVSYYRGKSPNKYLTLYRSEHDDRTNGDDHAKYFWMVEFANGENVGAVRLGIPRSNGTVQLEVTNDLATARSWIPDVSEALGGSSEIDYTYGWGGTAGNAVVSALVNDRLHAFVSRPTYFTSSPAELTIDFDLKGVSGMDDLITKLNEATIQPLETVGDSGPYQGYKNSSFGAGVSDEDLKGILAAMMDQGYVHCVENPSSLETGRNVQIMSAEDWAANLAADPNDLDEWLLVGSGDTAQRSLLKVHYQVQTANDMSTSQIRARINSLIDGAKPKIDSYKDWLDQDYEQAKKTTPRKVGGLSVVQAGDKMLTGSESDVYYVETQDANGDTTIELLTKYLIEEDEEYEGPKEYLYNHVTLTKSSYTIVAYNEKYGQRVTYTYTLASDQVVNPIDHETLCTQWYCLMDRMLVSSAMWEGFKQPQEPEGVDGAVSGGKARAPKSAATGESDALRAVDVGSEDALRGMPPVVEDFAAWVCTNAIQWSGQTLDFLYDPGNFPQDSRNLPDITDGETAFYNTRMGTHICPGMNVAFKTMLALDYQLTMAELLQPSSWFGWASMAFPTDSPEKKFQDVVSNGGGAYNWGDHGVDKQIEMNEDYKNFRAQMLYKLTGSTYDFGDLEDKYSPRIIANWKAKASLEMKHLLWMADELNNVAHDPSGIVYEGVLSNPVEGATVQLYTYNAAADRAGIDPSTFVDSAQFGIEENPQVTGADGRYQWFVPEGFWQVRVSKKDYDDFSSGQWGHDETWPVYDDEGNQVVENGTPQTKTVWVGDYGVGATKDLNGDGVDDAAEYWMPVLPVQLDVNIPLVSHEEPTVTSMEAGAEGLEVTFSKYMKVDTMVAGDFTVGGIAATRIEPLNAEPAGDGSVDEDGNPVMLASRFRVVYPENMTLSEDGSTVGVAFDAGNAQSYAGTPSAKSDNDTTALSAASIPKVATPTATIGTKTYGNGATEATATNVAAGTMLALATGTAGSTIYYTTDGTDPTTNIEGRKTYSGAIKLTGNTDLNIVAYKAGMYHSETLHLHVRVATAKQRVTWKRLWGQTALDTMQAIAKEFGSAKVAVVTTNADFHDALAASALAGANGALVLTTAKGSASKQTKAALKAAGVKTVYVVGRTSDVSKAAMNGLKYASGVTVKRVADKAGYSARAIELAKACGKRSDTVIIATQASFKDALSIAPYSYATKSPILYAESSKKLSDATLKYIKGAKFKRAIIVGGPLALSTEIEGQLKSKGGITSASNVMRLAGADPYATSEVIAKWATGQLKNGSTAGPYQGKMLSTIRFQPTVRLSANRLAVSTSRTTLKWKDALCGAALCGKNKGVLLLADDYDANGRAKNNYAKAVDFCHAGAAGMSRAYVLGGTSAVSEKVYKALEASTIV